MKSHLDLIVTGMHCDACVRRVRTAIAKVDGVGSVNVAIGSAQIQYDPAKTDALKLVAAVDRIGYDASIP